MIGVCDIVEPIIASDVTGNERVPPREAQPVWRGWKCQGGAGGVGGAGRAVGLEGHTP